MQQDQVKGILERASTVIAVMLLSWLVRKGWIGESDMATLLPAVVLVPSLVYGWWINRPKALVQSVASLPGTVIITEDKLAKATPETNVVSNINAKVVTEGEVETNPSVVVPPAKTT